VRQTPKQLRRLETGGRCRYDLPSLSDDAVLAGFADFLNVSSVAFPVEMLGILASRPHLDRQRAKQ
jgi:hypothetical protein